ncbi:hypothetical protein, partial [Pseudomonas sp. B9(2017)]
RDGFTEEVLKLSANQGVYRPLSSGALSRRGEGAKAASCPRMSSYRKMHDRKKPFYVFVKFIIPTGQQVLTAP